MRIGLDARPALFSRTGIARAARQTLLALSRRPGLQVVGYGAAWRRPLPDALLPGVATPRLPARLQRALAPLGFSVESLLGPLDVFHHTDLVYAPVRRAAQVLSLHDVSFLQGQAWHAADFVRTVEPRVRRAAAQAAAIVVPCERVRAEVRAHGFGPASRVHVVPLGCDHIDPAPLPDDAAVVAQLRARAGLPADDGAPLILVPGTREPRKNQLALLGAYLALPRAEEARLLFAGSAGWGCAELEASLADPALAGRVGVVGEVSEAQLGALLRRADIVAYPSLAEGFGLPVAEALRCGRAVLTARDTPMADYGGDAVLAVNPRDPAQLREALAALVASPARRAALGAAGRAQVAALTWEATAAALHRLYLELPRRAD